MESRKILIDKKELLDQILELKQSGKRIVMTNGCFDILHYGHITYLRQARSFGDFLLVALNSDASVHRLKGPTRPVTSEKERLEIVAALECVDGVTLFGEDTPYQLIEKILPHVLVKGGDWKTEQIVGGEIVEHHGGRVYSLPYVLGYSTTAILKKIAGN